ncbi:hypothetical protein ABEB36_011864 [Hypothenemus hampei]|uniref:inositol-1,4-bisphosphate 1-phosphatase n=1 Tax=Hypothenemus hampei TaxID=57062 RepID=A0ABD1EBY8_HYPHA
MYGDLLEILIVSSEKAANIARVLRQNEQLFPNLVEEKSLREANPRFSQDFKTLADVLIQEVIKNDVGSKFPSLKGHIKGEENNRLFSEKLQKEIEVEIKETPRETAHLLEELLEADIATSLAEEVHKEIKLQEVDTVEPSYALLKIPFENLIIWIDPIDGTNEYVKGTIEKPQGNFHVKGLKCVTVLIGAYDTRTGEPVIGVVNRPFFQKTKDQGCQCNWGVCVEQLRLSSIESCQWNGTGTICVGGSESDRVKALLEQEGFNLISSRGAGYKLLTVVLGLADAYVLSEGTTYHWDTCGPHAILKALNGNIVDFHHFQPINYGLSTYCNANGIVAYRDESVFSKLRQIEWGRL